MAAAKSNLSVRLAIRSNEVLRALREIIGRMDGFVLQEDPRASRVDILVLEVGNAPEQELETIRALMQAGVVGSLFITSTQATPEILLPALRAGAKEFFQQPINAQEVITALGQAKKLETTTHDAEAEPLQLGKIHCVLGAKGGVGSTTFAVNLATNLQAALPEKLIALVDLNRLTGEVPLFLDLETGFNWEEIGNNLNRLDEAYLKSALIRHASGIYVVPAPATLDLDGKTPANLGAHILSGMQSVFDHIIVDMEKRIDQEALHILSAAQQLYLIANLTMPCMVSVKRLTDTLREQGIQESKMRVVANRFEKKSHIDLQEAARIIGKEIDAIIPNDYRLSMMGINRGKPLAEVDSNSAAAMAYGELAESIEGVEGRQKSRRRGWGLFQRR